MGASTLARELQKALTRPGYIESMPVHSGAGRFLDELRKKHTVVVISSRPPEALSATESWLMANRLRFDELHVGVETGKTSHALDALVDDYVSNLEQFLLHTSGVGILRSHPWNQNLTPLRRYLGERRLAVCRRLADVVPAIDELMTAHDA